MPYDENDLSEWIYNESQELRLTLAEEPETVTAKHVADALEECSIINNSDDTWAELDIVPTKNGQVVHMRVGRIRSDGVRELETLIVSYTLENGVTRRHSQHVP